MESSFGSEYLSLQTMGIEKTACDALTPRPHANAMTATHKAAKRGSRGHSPERDQMLQETLCWHEYRPLGISNELLTEKLWGPLPPTVVYSSTKVNLETHLPMHIQGEWRIRSHHTRLAINNWETLPIRYIQNCSRPWWHPKLVVEVNPRTTNILYKWINNIYKESLVPNKQRSIC